MADSEPTSLQTVALNSLRNKLPTGLKLKSVGYGMIPGTKEGRKPDLKVTRFMLRDGLEVTDQFVIDFNGNVSPL
jgi:hypothetical protein